MGQNRLSDVQRGDNGTAWRVANYTVHDAGNTLLFEDGGEDSEYSTHW